MGLAGATGVTLANLVAEGRLTNNPPVTSLAVPDDATGKAAAAARRALRAARRLIGRKV